MRRIRLPAARADEELRGPSGRARLSDVAKLAGVSIGSASRALSVPEKVKQRTRDAVLTAVAQLGYVPNGNARSLAMQRSFTIGVLLPTVSNPVYAEFVHALQLALDARGYQLLVAAHEYQWSAEGGIVGRLLQHGVDGLVLVGADHHPQVWSHLDRARTPHVTAWSAAEAEAESVGFSNRRAMQQLTQHLTGLGHRNVAMLSGEVKHNERARARLDGVRDALELAGASLPAERVFFSDFSVDAGRQGLRAAIALVPRPTALICATDLMAAGALAEAKAIGIRVPEDLSITGFDDIELAALVTPRLTTMAVPASDMGRFAAAAIAARIEGGPRASSNLAARLVVRESTGPAPEAPRP